jgi:hypothetical protein
MSSFTYMVPLIISSEVLSLDVVHPVVFYNNGIPTEQPVKHNSNINLKYTLRWRDMFRLQVPTGHAHVQNERRNRKAQTQVSLQKVGPGYSPPTITPRCDNTVSIWTQPLNQHKDLRRTTVTHTVQQHPPNQRTWFDPHDARCTARHVIQWMSRTISYVNPVMTKNTIVFLFRFTIEHNTIQHYTIHVEHLKLEAVRHIQNPTIWYLLPSRLFECVLQNKNWFYLILPTGILVKLHRIP